MKSTLHNATPALYVIDPRKLAVRDVAYHRAVTDQPPEARVTSQVFDAAGRLVAQRDPRLQATSTHPNLVTVFSLSARPLLSKSVDTGWRLRLHGSAGELQHEWDARLSQRQSEYDALLRPVAISEQAANTAPCVTERFTYADCSAPFAAHNQCAQLIRHDDASGCLLLNDYSLTGAVLSESRRLLIDLQTPDWSAKLVDCEKLLETATATTGWQFNALGEVTSQLDARHNRTLTTYDISGQIEQVQLKQSDLPEKTVVSQITYNAAGRREQETAGNGVQTLRRFEAQSDRLLQLTRRLAAHCYQDEHYTYDPMGNLTHLEDAAQAILHFNNQRTTPINTYQYDTLYQLIHTTGREAIPSNPGPVLPDLHTPSLDPTRMAAYTQVFNYDAAGNLQTLIHTGSKGYTRTMATSPSSNRSLLKTGDGEPDFEASFDANGNLLQLTPGTQALRWDTRNQLSEVVQVCRDEAPNDDERYRYDATGQRRRKVCTRQTNTAVDVREVRYLPGLEIHYRNGQEYLHVIDIQTGNNSNVRVLHWPEQPPADISNNQVRYGFSNHPSTNSLELDDHAAVISQEGYYPFGGTAWWAATHATQARFKTIRYSMKERDTSGLYYYGLRYYAPWLQRWINPDPGGVIDGLNVFRFNRNNPLRFKDPDGAMPVANTEAVEADENPDAQPIEHDNTMTAYSYKRTKIKVLPTALEPTPRTIFSRAYATLKHTLGITQERAKPKSVVFYRIKEIVPGFVAAYEKRPGGEVRLNASAHGRDGVFWNADHHYFGAEDMAQLLEEHGYTEYDSIRLLSCNSADPSRRSDISPGQQLATLTNRPVKAFSGPAGNPHGPLIMLPYFKKKGITLSINDTVSVPRNEVMVKKPSLFGRALIPSYRRIRYEPKIFQPATR